MNKPVEARKALDEAITIIEMLRTQVAGGEEEQQRFFASKVSPYHLLIDLLTREGRPAEALTYAERAKARVLLQQALTRTKDVAAIQKYRAADLGGNYSEVARALGAWSRRIEKPDAFLPALQQAIEATQSGTPAVIECVAKQNFKYSRY